MKRTSKIVELYNLSCEEALTMNMNNLNYLNFNFYNLNWFYQNLNLVQQLDLVRSKFEPN